MGRLAGLFGLALLALALDASCKGGDKAESPGGNAETKAATVDPEKISKEEDDLLARRDALLATRLEIKNKRAELDEKRATIRSQGGDTSEVDKENDDLAKQESDLVGQEKDLNAKIDQVLSDRRAMMAALAAGGGSGASVAGREAGVAAREKDVARREKAVADREAALSTREEGLARKWKDSCGGGTTTIVQTVDPKGAHYSKGDVEPLLARARSEMNEKGILRVDLPDTVRDLESEATDAMAKADFGRAHLAASQLAGTVHAIKVDRAFISGKIARLNEVMKGKKLSDSQRTEVDQLFRDATASYGDGKFPQANKKLNKIYSTLGGA